MVTKNLENYHACESAPCLLSDKKGCV